MDDVENDPYAFSFLKNNGGCNESKALDMSVDSIPTISSSIALFQFSVRLISDVSVLCLFRYAVRFQLNLGSSKCCYLLAEQLLKHFVTCREQCYWPLVLHLRDDNRYYLS